ncbi:vancomycin high temperature exclusion protein [Varibaculum massiliense]|uniref:SanA/YdcF family protein n=1 Tax=Varibaculum massiliense TaxID=1852372 RepID=UPI002599FE64|nr:ElyC/SanA/YdcF family protein [Varibaculum massiliense]
MRALRALIRLAITLVVIAVIIVAGTNVYVWQRTKGEIISLTEAKDKNTQVILVLGAGVNPNGTPSPMLAHRLQTALNLYQAGAAKKILISGDHGQVHYDEIKAMKSWLINQGVPAQVIYADHAGFSTYESAYRAEAIFSVQRAIVVTQPYHLPRALYDCQSRGIEVWGVGAAGNAYPGQTERNLREYLARTKDVIWVATEQKPTYLGPKISLDGPASATDG